MSLGPEPVVDPHDAAPVASRGAIVPMLGPEKRTRIYAVLAFAFRSRTNLGTALEIFEQACNRKGQEDKPLGIAVGQIREDVAGGQELGESLRRVLGRMLSVEEVSILQLLTTGGGDDSTEEASDPGSDLHLHAMEMLLRLREIDLLEGRRPQ
ncbi:hypothetical protein [Methylobacterium radiotolerans]|uniref:hypothetical protein n=1 Tax=Methylobacterium radiotolerans TaxID=31998 RepID=UPI0038D1228F